VAVAVEEQAPLVVLDEGDRIVGVGPRAESQFGPLVGEVMWDCFPGSEPLFKPYYDHARRSGEPVEFEQFYDGSVARVRAVPRGRDRLELYWHQLTRLDTLTLGGLVASLDESLAVLGSRGSSTERQGTVAALRVLEGGT
jgi:hypothetical protein